MPRRPAVLPLVLSIGLGLSACASSGGDPRDGGTGAADGGGGSDAGARDAGPAFVDSGPRADAGERPPSCVEHAQWIYVVDRDRRLAQFRPNTMELVDVGTITCDSGAGTPRSMSIDQNGVAHVLYSDGRVYQVSTTDASCSASGSAPTGGDFTHFGMGFSADGPESATETLFVVGGDIIDLMEDQDPLLASLDTTTHALSPIGTLSDWVELSGNRAGELYTFRPSNQVFSTITPARVDRLDKSTGASLEGWDLDLMTGDLRAWAFAYWGARFYIFIQEDLAPSSDVWRFTPETGELERVFIDVARGITGAGVSICAPVTLI